MRRLALLLLAALATGQASASTDCPTVVSSVLLETGSKSGYTVTLHSGLAFAMKADSGGYREVLAASQMSLMSSSGLTARFAADGVACNKPAMRTDLVAIILGGPPMTPTVPPPSTVRP